MIPVRGELSYATSEADVSAYLANANQEGIGVVVTGAPGIGKTIPGDRDRAFLSLAEMNRITRHDAEDLTLTTEPGATIADIANAVGRHGQRLLIEVPDPEQWTIGGVIGARADGFLAMAFGPVRDQILGLRVCLADGRVTKTGGKVVKNVTGYDLAKLYTGSRGTLGVITEVTLRLRSRAPMSRTFIFERPTVAAAAADAARLRNLPCTVTAVAVAGGNAVAEGTGPWLCSLRVEGRRETLADAARLVREVAGAHHQLTEGEEAGFWRATTAFSSEQAHALRIWVAPSKIAKAVELLDRAPSPTRGFIIDYAAGRIDIADADPQMTPDEMLVAVNLPAFEELFSPVIEVLDDPLDWKLRDERFGSLAAGELRILGRLKRIFDPEHILGSGRIFEER